MTSGVYTINGACTAPSFTPVPGAYGLAQSVTISTSTAGATIMYTTDGSTPSETAGTVYSGAVNISASCTLQAIAYESGWSDSAVTSGVYTINGACAAPSFTPAPGTYALAQSVTISTATGGATIRYTTDGSTPGETAGTVYSTPVSISATRTLKAIAYASGWNDSPVTSGVYTITVTPVAIAQNDSYSVIAENVLTVNAAQGVLANDSLQGATGTLTTILHSVPANGALKFSADGSFSYTPNTGFSGTDSFVYRATNGTLVSNYATVTITVTPALFSVSNQSYTDVQENTLTVAAAQGLLNNDSNPDGLPLTAAIHTSPAHGSLKINPDGSFSYTPNTGFNGTDSFTFRAIDGTVQSNSATVTITVTPALFVANADTYICDVGQPMSVTAAQGVLANDSNPAGYPLTASIHSSTTHGTMKLNADGSFTYTPNAGYSGTDSFTYRATDGPVVSNIATVTITFVTFSVSNRSYTVMQDNTLTVAAAQGLLNNDSNPAGLPLTAAIHTSSAHGALKINTDGSFSYTPNTGFHGTDSFTFRAIDGTAQSNSATVTITVTPALFSVSNQSYTDVQENTLTVAAAQGLLNNDSNPDGLPLTAAIHTSPAHGSLKINPDGSFSYTPNTGFNGTDSFTFRAIDGTVQSNSATVTITVTPALFVANADNYTCTLGQKLTVTAAQGVLANDSNPGGYPLTASIHSATTHGSMELNADGSFSYTPNAGFSGTDSFTYRATDGTVVSNIATVTINVTP